MQSLTGKQWPNISIASCDHCQCSDFQGSRNHLSITITKINLKHAKAVAISYTWGEFDREDGAIGHPPGNPAKKLMVNLGKEWSKDDFATSLARLTESHHAFWLDQLCIPQNSLEVKEALGAIPLVYKYLSVIALFPGSLCKCLGNAFKEYQIHKAERSHLANIDEDMALEISGLDMCLDGSDCLSSNGSCTYTDRIWPAQEIRYASIIKIMWASCEIAPCYNGDGQQQEALIGLRGYTRELYKSMLSYKSSQEQPLSHEDIIQKLRTKNTSFIEQVKGSLMYKRAEKGGSSYHEESLDKIVACFLLGKTVQEQHVPADDEEETTVRFFNNCEDIAHTQRKASNMEDYVLSVWVDWSPYKIPDDFQKLSVYQLLGDALRTSHRPRYQYFVPSTFPVGLLGSDQDSGRWAGPENPPARPVRDIRDIYRPFSWRSRFEVLVNGKIGLRVLPKKHHSIKQYFTFEQWTAGLDASDVQDKFHDAVDYISPDTATEGNQGIRFGVFVPPTQRKNLKPLTSEFVFDLFCGHLYIDSKVCAQNDVLPIFTTRTVELPIRNKNPKQIPCMGLANKHTLDRIQQNNLPTLTIALTGRENVPFYEAVLIDELSDEPELFMQYAIFAVWLPLRGYDCYEVEAVLKRVGCNAYVY